MPAEPVVTPVPTASPDIIVDWLELTAFFNRFRVARIDELVAALEEQAEYTENDEPSESASQFGDAAEGNIGAKDKALDALRENIENEFDQRSLECEGAYPFNLSDDAEEITLVDNWEEAHYAAYITCLLSTHLTKASLFDFQTPDALIQRLRNRVFQVISTLALAGKAGGGAASIGWPREDKATIIETLQRAEARKSAITPRNAPRPYARHAEKDGGIDVLAWSDENNPPPTQYFYGQVASGHDWRGKSVRPFVERFEGNYMDVGPITNVGFATLMPFRIVDETLWYSEIQVHGDILERTRLPRHVNIGLDLAANGVEMDEAENVGQVSDWINDFRASALAGA